MTNTTQMLTERLYRIYQADNRYARWNSSRRRDEARSPMGMAIYRLARMGAAYPRFTDAGMVMGEVS